MKFLACCLTYSGLLLVSYAFLDPIPHSLAWEANHDNVMRFDSWLASEDATPTRPVTHVMGLPYFETQSSADGVLNSTYY